MYSFPRKQFGETSATVWLGGMKAYAVAPEHYGRLINDTKTLTNKKLSEVAMVNIFGSTSGQCGTKYSLLYFALKINNLCRQSSI